MGKKAPATSVRRQGRKRAVPAAAPAAAPVTPDGRYVVIDGRLWRRTRPGLSGARRDRLVRALMRARRAIRQARAVGDLSAEQRARRRVHDAKVALGERGPVWWTDGAPDLSRRLVRNTCYARWYARLA